MSVASGDVYPIWSVDEVKHVFMSKLMANDNRFRIKDRKHVKEITQQFRVKVKGLRKSETKQLKSPDLMFTYLDKGLRYYLTLEPKVKHPDSGHYYLGLHLHLQCTPFETFSGQISSFQVSVSDTKCGKIRTKTSGQLYFSYGYGWGWKYFVDRDELSAAADDTGGGGGKCRRSLDLNLLVAITLHELKDQSAPGGAAPVDMSGGDHFAFNHDLLTDQHFCDITFICDGRETRAHSKLVGAKSPVLKSIAAKQKVIPIVSMDAIVFYELILFLYNDYSPNIEKYCRELLMAADEYRIRHLKYVCDNLCFRRLRPEEAIDALVFAVKYRTISARIRALCYIAVHLDSVADVCADKWQKFGAENQVLFQEIQRIATMKCLCDRH